MGSAGVVEVVDLSAERSSGVRHIGVGPQIDLLVFNRPPEPLDEHVILPRAFAVHADGDLVFLEQINGKRCCQATALSSCFA